MPPAPASGMIASARTNRMSYVPSMSTWTYRLEAYNCSSGKMVWVNKKTRIALAPCCMTFTSTTTKTSPLTLVVLQTVRVLIANWTAGVNEVWHHWRDGTNSGTKLWCLCKHSTKGCQGEDGPMRRMKWCISLRRKTYGSKKNKINPVYARIKTKSQNFIAKICIKKPFTISPMKLQRSAANQL